MTFLRWMMVIHCIFHKKNFLKCVHFIHIIMTCYQIRSFLCIWYAENLFRCNKLQFWKQNYLNKFEIFDLSKSLWPEQINYENLSGFWYGILSSAWFIRIVMRGVCGTWWLKHALLQQVIRILTITQNFDNILLHCRGNWILLLIIRILIRLGPAVFFLSKKLDLSFDYHNCDTVT